MKTGLSLSCSRAEIPFLPRQNEAVACSAVLSYSDVITFRVGVGPNLTAPTLTSLL